jgi:hypothetical protein
MASHPRSILSSNTCRHVFSPKQKKLVIPPIAHLALFVSHLIGFGMGTGSQKDHG